MQPNTHLSISSSLCGTIKELKPGFSKVTLLTTDAMAVDDHALIHGGFCFSMADYAAMLAVNDQNVVLGAADVKFLKPATVGDLLEAIATVKEVNGRKHIVEVIVSRGDTLILSGSFTCFILDKHVLG